MNVKKIRPIIFAFPIVILGCASNPISSTSNSPSDYVKQINGKRFNFVKANVFDSSISAQPNKEYGILGIKSAITPLVEFCNKESSIIKVISTSSVPELGNLPAVLNCENSGGLQWQVTLSYAKVEKSINQLNGTNWVYVTIMANLSTGSQVRELQEQEKILTYRRQFQEIRTADMAEKFVSKYSAYDPDNLIPEAKRKLANLTQEELSRIRQANQAKADRIQRREDFRKSIKIGDNTFCGPVVELKYPMVKIAIDNPIQGYSSEAWLKIDQIYPSDYGCRNINGKLSPINN